VCDGDDESRPRDAPDHPPGESDPLLPEGSQHGNPQQGDGGGRVHRLGLAGPSVEQRGEQVPAPEAERGEGDQHHRDAVQDEHCRPGELAAGDDRGGEVRQVERRDRRPTVKARIDPGEGVQGVEGEHHRPAKGQRAPARGGELGGRQPDPEGGECKAEHRHALLDQCGKPDGGLAGRDPGGRADGGDHDRSESGNGECAHAGEEQPHPTERGREPGLHETTLLFVADQTGGGGEPPHGNDNGHPGQALPPEVPGDRVRTERQRDQVGKLRPKGCRLPPERGPGRRGRRQLRVRRARRVRPDEPDEGDAGEGPAVGVQRVTDHRPDAAALAAGGHDRDGGARRRRRGRHAAAPGATGAFSGSSRK
jgi:hypothetical protein